MIRYLLPILFLNSPALADDWSYDVRYRGQTQLLEVDAVFQRIDRLEMDAGSLPFLGKVEEQKGDSYRELNGRDGNWPIACKKSCRIRYTFDFAKASRHPSSDVLKVFGKILIHNPSIWIIRPARYDGNPSANFRFAADGDAEFATGLFPARKAGTYEASARILADMPWTIFGPFDQHLFTPPGAKVELAIVPATYKVDYAAINAWAKRAIDALIAYYGKFPVPHALVIVLPRSHSSGPGTSYGDGGAVTLNPLASDASEKDLREDWVMTHEMVHLAFPMVFRKHHWIEEGLATYVEPLARMRSGELAREGVYRDMILGMPQGLPKEGDRGLDNTPTWGRTYWGGALFAMLADIELREKSKGRIGLDTALRAIIKEGGSLAVQWDIKHALEVADRGTGFRVLQDLYAKMKDAPYPVDLDALWKKLGVELHVGGRVTFDDKAPLAFVRKSWEAGT